MIERGLDISASPTALAWQRFKKNKLAMLGLVVIGLATTIAILGGNVRPDGTQNANSQHLALATAAPGSKVAFLTVRKNEPERKAFFFERLFFGGSHNAYTEIPLHTYRISTDSVVGFQYGGRPGIAGMPFAYHIADVVYALDPERIEPTSDGYIIVRIDTDEKVGVMRSEVVAALQKSSLVTKRFWLGTDKFGRDMLSRLMAGTIVSLSVGLISVLISLVLGLALGAIAGYFRGWVDDGITWLINVVWSIPTLLLVVAITFALGKGFVQVFVAVGLTMWVEVARVVRGQVLSVRTMEYVEAAKVLGYSSGRIISGHILPNVMGPVVVISAANFASAILLEAGLSFLGIGAQIPMASWGQMIKEHYPYITTAKAYLALLPGASIVLLVLAFMLVGNGLRDSLDTRAAH